jgi:hypothetical protein
MCYGHLKGRWALGGAAWRRLYRYLPRARTPHLLLPGRQDGRCSSSAKSVNVRFGRGIVWRFAIALAVLFHYLHMDAAFYSGFISFTWCWQHAATGVQFSPALFYMDGLGAWPAAVADTIFTSITAAYWLS